MAKTRVDPWDHLSGFQMAYCWEHYWVHLTVHQLGMRLVDQKALLSGLLKGPQRVRLRVGLLAYWSALQMVHLMVFHLALHWVTL